ncbi:MAG TPA: CHAT domain-containing protein [Albitalea sp.]|nr:CHAT domain-containing protein [Albitalea sp.]
MLLAAPAALAQNIGAPVLSEKAPRPALPGVTPDSAAASLVKRADEAYDSGGYEEALRLYEDSASAARMQPNQALILWHRIGRTQTKLRRLDDAMASFDRGLELVAGASASARAFTEPVLREARGETLRAMGKPEFARAEYQRAFEGYAALGKPIETARMQSEIGSTFADEARFDKALEHYADARRRMQEARSPELGRLLVNTSSLLTWLGKYDDANALQEQAERACEAADDALCQASAAHVRGFTRFHEGDYDGAVTASRRAVALFGPAPTAERARALNNLGLSLVALHRPEEGLRALTESLDILEKTNGSAKDKATTIDSLGTAYRVMGDTRQASALYQDALLRWRAAGHREGERDTLSNLGQLASDMKQRDASIFFYKLSVNLAQSLRADARRLEAGYLDSVTRRLAPSYQTLAGLLVDEGRLAEAQQVMRMLKEQELFDFLRRGGPAGNTTAALNGLEQDKQSAYDGIQLRVFQLARELEKLNAKPSASMSDADKARKAEVEALLQQARNELEVFCRQLDVGLAAVAPDAPRVAVNNLVALQASLRRLGHGAVLLHFVPLEDRLSIILTAGSNLAVRGYSVAVTQTQLNQTVARFHEEIQALSPAATATAQTLYGWLMPEALRRDLADADARILMVSLNGVLRYLPVAALYDGRQWLAERYAIAMYTDAVTASLEHTPNPQWAVRAFGMTQASEGLPALGWVRQELQSIVGDQGLPGSTDLDADFTVDKLHDAVYQTQPPVLHIASHFVFRPGTEDDSFLLLGVGRLPLSTIKQWQFSGLDLLTLSACETGMGGGRNRNGQEIEGFAALAQAQGADAVMATLWSVADVSTAAFMQSFYRTRRTQPGLTKVEAMQRVQQAMLRGEITPSSARETIGVRGTVEGGTTAAAPADYRHPFFWAPFVLVGNWR